MFYLKLASLLRNSLYAPLCFLLFFPCVAYMVLFNLTQASILYMLNSVGRNWTVIMLERQEPSTVDDKLETMNFEENLNASNITSKWLFALTNQTCYVLHWKKYRLNILIDQFNSRRFCTEKEITKTVGGCGQAMA